MQTQYDETHTKREREDYHFQETVLKNIISIHGGATSHVFPVHLGCNEYVAFISLYLQPHFVLNFTVTTSKSIPRLFDVYCTLSLLHNNVFISKCKHMLCYHVKTGTSHATHTHIQSQSQAVATSY